MRASASSLDSPTASKGKHVQLASLEIDEPHHRRGEVSSIVDPHAAAVTSGGGDLVSSVLAIIKGMVGPAILYLPHGFATAGYMVALSIMALSTLMYLYSSKCLLDAWKFESHKMAEQEVEPLQQHQTSSSSPTTTDIDDHSPPPTTTTTPLSYPELAFRAFGKRGETLVKHWNRCHAIGRLLDVFYFCTIQSHN